MPFILNPHRFGGGGSTSYEDEVLADSPLAYWRLGEASGTTMVDASGNTRNGTWGGSPTFGATGATTTDSDTATTFDGTDDHGGLSYAAWMDASTAFTVACWIKTSASTQRPLVDRDHSSGRVFQYRLEAATGKFQFIKIGGTGGVVSATSTVAVNNNVWRHLVATYDGSNIRLYIDGALDNTVAASGTLGTGNSPLEVGASFEGTSSLSRFYLGDLDEVAIFNTALSGTRIAAHYAAA